MTIFTVEFKWSLTVSQSVLLTTVKNAVQSFMNIDRQKRDRLNNANKTKGSSLTVITQSVIALIVAAMSHSSSS